MSSPGSMPQSVRAETATSQWLRRFLIVLTVLGLCALGGLLLWGLGLIAGPLSLLLLAALLAYILYPAVASLQHHMSRFFAILLVFVGAVLVVTLVGFGILSTLVTQLAALIDAIHHLPKTQLPQWLQSIGITPSHIQASAHQTANLLQAFQGKVLPTVGNLFLLALKSIVVAALLVYFLIYGPRALGWVRREVPLRSRASANYFLDTVDQVMGGFLRGAVFLASIMGVATGLGALLLGIPYWLLIALIVFVSEFIPVIGAYISGFLGTLLALTQGWQTGLIYFVFATILQGLLDAQVLIPRIIGKHTGVNPIIATFALLVGATLFGVAGAVLAIPVVAIVQILLSTAWKMYRSAHPEDFPSQQGPAPEPNRATTDAAGGSTLPSTVGAADAQSGS